MSDGIDSAGRFAALPASVALSRCETGESVLARIVDLPAKLAKTRMGAAWWRGLGVSKSRREREEDHHWNRAKLIGLSRNDLFVESVAVQTVDENVQGAMIYRLNGRSVLLPGAPAVVIDRLATAPRNRGWVVSDPMYRGAGTALTRWAAYHSYHLGFDSRPVLAAIPCPGTVAFYESLGFRATDAVEEDMVIYELEPAPAQALMLRTEDLS